MLTIYIVLLVGVPSYVTIPAFGAIGRPSVLWGLGLLLWWVLWRLQRRQPINHKPSQPVRVAFGAIVVVVLLSFASAMLRGQPADQVSPAISALLRLLSWSGIFLVTLDGIRSRDDLERIVRRLAVCGGLLAALGLVQFATGRTMLEWLTLIPGIGVEGGGVDSRGAFTRASGTATHPLEYATVLSATVPLALMAAVTSGFDRDGKSRGRWWISPAMISLASVVAVSRSAIIGLVVAVAASLPGLPRNYRVTVLLGGLVVGGAVSAAVPGVLTTLISLFAGAGDDPSTQSRANALARVPEFIESSPLIGQGFGLFLPRYYIFDNQWVLLVVEVGVLGALAFASLTATSVWSAVRAARSVATRSVAMIGWAIAASMITVTVLLIFFDGLAFPMSAGLFFMLAGLSGSVRRIAWAEQSGHPLP